MPALPSVPGAAKVAVTFIDNQTLHKPMVRFHYHWTSGTPDSSDMLALATNVYNVWAVEFATNDFTANGTMLKAVAEDLSSATGPIGEYDHVTNATGPSGTGGQVCGLVNWKIARRYRGGKPKTFVPLVSTFAMSDEAHITTGFQGRIQRIANNLAGGSGTVLAATYPNISGLHMVNVSYFEGFTNYTKPSGRESSRPTVRSSPLLDTITGWAVPLLPATQRRRLQPS